MDVDFRNICETYVNNFEVLGGKIVENSLQLVKLNVRKTNWTDPELDPTSGPHSYINVGVVNRNSPSHIQGNIVTTHTLEYSVSLQIIKGHYTGIPTLLGMEMPKSTPGYPETNKLYFNTWNSNPKTKSLTHVIPPVSCGLYRGARLKTKQNRYEGKFTSYVYPSGVVMFEKNGQFFNREIQKIIGELKGSCFHELVKAFAEKCREYYWIVEGYGEFKWDENPTLEAF